MSKAGDEIRHMREAKMMSLHEMAKLSGVHVSTLSKIESGDTEKVRFSTIRKISKAFKMDPFDFAKRVGVIENGAKPEQTGGTDGETQNETGEVQ